MYNLDTRSNVLAVEKELAEHTVSQFCSVFGE